jgi:hypothetical protein
MSSPSRFSRAEIVMDCIAVVDLALLLFFTVVSIVASPALPFRDING